MSNKIIYGGLVFAQLFTFVAYAVVTAGAGTWAIHGSIGIYAVLERVPNCTNLTPSATTTRCHAKCPCCPVCCIPCPALS